jgi:hypothetical protein
MKLQLLNTSFGKVLAAVAIAFMIYSAAPAQAQQGRWGTNGCYYIAQGGQWLPQGCAVAIGGSTFYYDSATRIITDYATHLQFFMGQDGRALIYTTAGWQDLAAYVQAVRASSASAARGTCVPHSGPGWVGTGCPSPDVSPAMAAILIAQDSANSRAVATTLSPNCSPGATGGRGCYVYAH